MKERGWLVTKEMDY